MKLSKIKTLKYQIIPLNSSTCYYSGQLTGIAIMHEDKLAQWLVTIGKNTKNTYKLNLCFLASRLALGYYGKH